MAITNSKQGVWGINEVYNKVNQKHIWEPSNTLWAWGNGYYGQLGLNQAPVYVSSPVQIGSHDNWSDTQIMGLNSLAVNDKGQLWIWGYNRYQMLSIPGILPGPSDYFSRSSPVQIPGNNWDMKSSYNGCGKGTQTHIALLKTDGTLWTWGQNEYGQLGQNQHSLEYQWATSSPVQVPGTDWANVSRGNHFTIARKANGTIWAWGDNDRGQLGLGDTIHRSSPVQIGQHYHWATDKWQKIVTKGANGYASVLGIKYDGTLWGWGFGSPGMLGLNQGSPTLNRSSPTQVGTDSDWKDINIGNSHAYGIRSNGKLYAWGSNSAGQLGQNDRTQRSSPTQVFLSTEWHSLSNYSDGSSCAFKNDGSLWVWGMNDNGGLGTGESGPNRPGYSSPVQLPGRWTSINMAGEYTTAIKATSLKTPS